MSKNIFCLVLLLLTFSFHLLRADADYLIKSPDKKISVSVHLASQQQAFYRIDYDQIPILQESRMGVLREDVDFTRALHLDSASHVEVITDVYQILQRTCHYTAHRRIFYFTTSSGKKINIFFQVSNDGVAFRYSFPDSSGEVKRIQKEYSSFHFLPGTRGMDSTHGYSEIGLVSGESLL